MHIVIVDIIGTKCIRIINVYRSFRPVDMTPSVFFKTQLGVLVNALCKNCYILRTSMLLAKGHEPEPHEALKVSSVFSLISLM